MFDGKFRILNAEYGVLFAADGDKDGSDHLVETRGDVFDADSDKFYWSFEDAGGGTWNIRNHKRGYLFAASGKKDGKDHVVEARPSASSSDRAAEKFRWRVTEEGGYFTLENVAYGALFAADSYKKGGDHVAEARPSPSSSDLKRAKFAWFVDAACPPEGWMGRLSGSRSIADLSIPGTHESCARHGGSLVECQSLSLKEQLGLGVRFLDIRCKNSGSHFSIFHGSFYQKLSFGDVIEDCVAFLDANPTESIIMSVKKEGSGDDPTLSFSARFDEYVKRNPDRWHLGCGMPTLDAVRNKIVLLRRFSLDDGEACKGIDAKKGWGNNDSSTIEYTADGVPVTLRVQDKYKNQSVSGKMSAIEDTLDDAQSGKRAGALYLNFTSAYATIPDQGAFARQINPKVREAVFRQHGRLGTLPMNFVDYRTCRYLIAANL